MSPAVTICKDADHLAMRAADLITQAAQGAIRARGRAMVALAGGSTPEKTYSVLAQPDRRSRVDWAFTYLFFGDERMVRPDDPSSNFAMVRRTLLAPVRVPAGHAFEVPTQLGTPAAAAEYAATLIRAFGMGDGLCPPRFDLILLGLGEDGHTASLFPGAASLWVTDRWVVASPPGTLPPAVERITLTFPVLNAARAILFLVSGENKAEVLHDVLEGQPTREERPAAYVRPVDGTLTWLVDEAAASRLTGSGQTPAGGRRGRDVTTTALDDGRNITVRVAKPARLRPASPPAARPLKLPVYRVGAEEATRQAFGDALVAVGADRPGVVVLDGEVSNSTFTEEFNTAYPDRFFEMYIAEQQLVSAALGLSVLGKVTFAATFAAFLTRAFDQIRMAAVSGASLRLCGTHAGVSIGEDGPSQMALEDLAIMRAVHGSTVLYPCDANQTASLVRAMVDLPGISYLRATRAKTPVIYPPSEAFPIGGSKVLRRSDADRVAVVAAGITLHESLRACEQLETEGIRVRVVDAYSVKPIDTESLHEAARVTGGRLVVVEDHWPEGGLGDAVLGAFVGVTERLPTVIRLAVRSMPTSGTPAELLSAAGIDAEHIAQAVRECLLEPPLQVSKGGRS